MSCNFKVGNDKGIAVRRASNFYLPSLVYVFQGGAVFTTQDTFLYEGALEQGCSAVHSSVHLAITIPSNALMVYHDP